MEVYIVTKSYPLNVTVNGVKSMSVNFTTNEAVLDSEAEAKKYINNRRKAKDPDDRGCTFGVEPWNVFGSNTERSQS